NRRLNNSRDPLYSSYCNSYFLFRIVVVKLVCRQFFNCQAMQESGGCENISIGFDLDVFGAKSLYEKPPRGVGSESPIILGPFAAPAFGCDSGNCDKNTPARFQNTLEVVDGAAQVKNRTEDLSANNAVVRAGGDGVRLCNICDNRRSRVLCGTVQYIALANSTSAELACIGV